MAQGLQVRDSLWALSRALGGMAPRRLALLARSEVGFQSLVGRCCLRAEDLLKSEQTREDRGKYLLLTREALAFSKHSDQGQSSGLII